MAAERIVASDADRRRQLREQEFDRRAGGPAAWHRSRWWWPLILANPMIQVLLWPFRERSLLGTVVAAWSLGLLVTAGLVWAWHRWQGRQAHRSSPDRPSLGAGGRSGAAR